MRGARRLGALFLCVVSLVAALEGDEQALKTAVNAVDGNVIVDVAEGKFSDEERVSMLKRMFSSGFVATVDSDGNPIMVKKMPEGEFKAEEAQARLSSQRRARRDAHLRVGPDALRSRGPRPRLFDVRCAGGRDATDGGAPGVAAGVRGWP